MLPLQLITSRHNSHFKRFGALAPGGELSFNQRVGERTFARGFRPAKELANRRLVDGIGGGVCQVAGTLHAAAFLAGFEIPVHQPHSRPVSYIPMGLDTMVSWPNRDLRIRNPYPFPIRITAETDGQSVRVALYGAGKPHPVDWDKAVVERVPGGMQEVTDPALAPGESQLVQRASDGLLIERTRTVYLPTGPAEQVRKLRYPPTPQITALGPEPITNDP